MYHLSRLYSVKHSVHPHPKRKKGGQKKKASLKRKKTSKRRVRY